MPLNVDQAADQLIEDQDLLHQIVHGDENTTVTTESGERPSIAKTINDQIIVPNNDTAANKQASETAANTATVAATAALGDADRAVAAQAALTTELADAQQARDDAQAAAALATSTKIGDEDYIIPAVTQLLATYSDVVDTAISDDVWAEHAHKWGAPKKVLAVAESGKVVLHDLTKPSLPVWWSVTQGARSSVIGWENRPITGIQLVAGSLLVGNTDAATADYWSGLGIIDFASGELIKYGAPTKTGRLSQGIDEAEESAELSGTVFADHIISRKVNSVAAYIADDATKHPISGLSMPTISVATDEGVSELVPDGAGSWSVRNPTKAVGRVCRSVDYNMRGELHALVGGGENNGDGNPYWYVFVDGVDTTSYNTVSAVPVMTVKNWSQQGEISNGLFARYYGLEQDVLARTHFNPSAPAEGMVAYLSDDYSTPFMVGDVLAAMLCDGEEGVVADTPLAIPGYILGGSVSLSGNIATFTAASWGYIGVDFVTEPGKAYSVTIDPTITSASCTDWFGRAYDVGSASTLGDETGIPLAGNANFSFVAKASSTRVYAQLIGAPTIGDTIALDVIEVSEAARDYSGRGNDVKGNGALNFSKPAGSDVAVASGFSDVNNLTGELAFSGTDFSASGVATYGNSDDQIFTIGSTADAGAVDGVNCWAYYGKLKAKVFGVNVHTDVESIVANQAFAFTVQCRGGMAEIWVNGRKINGKDVSASLPASIASSLIIGAGFHAGSVDELSQFVVSNTPLSADQIRDDHRDMLAKLKKPSMLTGTVKALAHDAVRGDDWIACSDGQIHRLTQGGTTIEESITVDVGVGTIASLTVNDGEITVGGSTGVWVKQPDKNLRSPQVKRGKSVQPFTLDDGTGTQADFYLPYGWKPVRARIDGVGKRKGPSDSWTPQYDGYRWFVRINAGSEPALNALVECDAVEV